MDSGYIGLFRRITDSWIFEDPIVLKVFIYLLCKAAKTPATMTVNNQEVKLKQGQHPTGRKALMKALNLTEREARGSLEKLVNNKVVGLETSSTFSIITLLKYSHYQGVLKKKQEPIVQQEDVASTIVDRPLDTVDFDIFWGEFPRKQSKSTARSAWKRLRPSKPTLSLIMKGLQEWKLSSQWAKDKGQVIPYASTWLNQRRWEDELEIKNTTKRVVNILPKEL